MGCNCKTTERIIKMHKEYGYKVNTSWGEKIKFRISEIIKILITLFIVLIFSPLIFIVLIICAFIGKTTININNVFKFFLKKKK